MPTNIDEPITVTLSSEGEPRTFVWRRFEYEVIGVPQAFFKRRSWWRERDDLARIDQELWRVEASCTGTSDDAHTYDLARHGDTEAWRLALAWE